jgi:hypothetical protein
MGGNISRMGPEPRAAASDAQGVAVWAQYSKERYDAAERRVADFRGWARQLAAAIAVVVGLEGTLRGQLGKSAEGSPLWLTACLVVLLCAVVCQIVLLGKAVKNGYVGRRQLGPERPAVVADHVTTDLETRRITGAYYAMGADNLHELAEGLAGEVAGVARSFAATLWLVFAAMALTAGMYGVSSLARKPMSNSSSSSETPSPQPAPASAAPAADAAKPAASPAPSPLLVTSTPGQRETRTAEPPVVKLTATPTAGQKITERRGGEAK